MSDEDLLIDVHNLNKHFGSKHVVKDLSMQICKGEVYGFLVPNGSGKTTTIRMLCGLLTPDSGTGRCLGYDILHQAHLIRLRVGYMTQKFSLYQDLTVQENLEFIARVYDIPNPRDHVKQVIDRFHLTEFRSQFTGNLSGGWKQRTALAAEILHDPELLLLDEPTAGVDPKARRDFWDIIHEFSDAGLTTLVSTHYMDEAERCTHLAYISAGELLVQGTVGEIIKHVGLTTWSIETADVYKLSKKLQDLPGVEQVAIFGGKLHVSSKHAALLKQSLDECSFLKDHKKERIHGNLEDDFINLVNRKQKGETFS